MHELLQYISDNAKARDCRDSSSPDVWALSGRSSLTVVSFRVKGQDTGPYGGCALGSANFVGWGRGRSEGKE